MAQQADDSATSDFFHGVLFKEEVAPDAIFYIQPAVGNGKVDVQMLVELSAVRMQGAEDTTSTLCLRAGRSMVREAARNRALSRDQLLLKKGHKSEAW